MRLIDADEMISIVYFIGVIVGFIGGFAIHKAISDNRGARMKHGRWETLKTKHTPYLWEKKRCSICGFIKEFVDGHTAQYNYCPNCGAKMDEVKE